MTHTIKVIAGGLVLLALCLLIGRWVGGATPAIGLVRAVKVFVPLWFIAAGINMWVGVSKAGYSVEFIDYTQVDANVELAPR